MEQRLSLLTLGVKNIESSRHFYERSLGWKVLHAVEDVVFFQLPGFALALYPRDKLAEDAHMDAGSGFGGFTLAYNVEHKAEVDAVMKQAEIAGAFILKKPQDTFWGGYAGYFSDPDGHVWEVAYGTFYTVTEDGRTIFNF